MECKLKLNLRSFKTSLATLSLVSLLNACAPMVSLGYLESLSGALSQSLDATITLGNLKPGFEYIFIEFVLFVLEKYFYF